MTSNGRTGDDMMKTNDEPSNQIDTNSSNADEINKTIDPSCQLNKTDNKTSESLPVTSNEEIVTKSELKCNLSEIEIRNEESIQVKKIEETYQLETNVNEPNSPTKSEKDSDDTNSKENIKNKSIESHSALYKTIYINTNKSLDEVICHKLQEFVDSNIIIEDDLNDLNLLDLLASLNSNCLKAFDEFIQNFNIRQAEQEKQMLLSENNEESKKDDEQKQEKEQEGNITNDIINKTNTELLIESVANWKKTNSHKIINEANSNSDRTDSQINSVQGAKYQQKSERPGPNEQKLKEILERTGYSHEVSIGQRKYGGPPPNWSTEVAKAPETDATATNDASENEASKQILAPPPGCECFVGKLPRYIFEDELILLFEKQGRIWDLRLMIDPNTGFNKGYCFVTYCDKDGAKMAVKNLNNYEIRRNKPLRVNLSVANVKLFIANIPKTKTKEELKKELEVHVEGLNDVVISNQLDAEADSNLKNRGFCFAEFIDHKSASVAKRKLASLKPNDFFTKDLTVDWAEQNDEEAMSKVKALYVKNISNETSEKEVETLFEQYGKLERVRKVKDFAFVHFENREDAIKAMEELQSKCIGTNQIEISLARPLTDKKLHLLNQKRNEVRKFNNFGPSNNMNTQNNWNQNNFNNQSNNQRQQNNFNRGNFARGRMNSNQTGRGHMNGNVGNRFNNGRQNNFNVNEFNPNNVQQNYAMNNGGGRNFNMPNYNPNSNNLNQQNFANFNMQNKRRMDGNDSNFNKRPRFNPNHNNNNDNLISTFQAVSNWNTTQMQQHQQQFTNSFFNSNNPTSENEFYQDTFDSSQWL